VNVAIRDKAVLAALNAFDVAAYLRAAGWLDATRVPGGAHVWQKETPKGPAEVWVPLDHDLADYAARMAETLQVLATVEDRSELEVLADLTTVSQDVIRVRVLGRDPGGHSLPLEDGVLLVQGSRDMVMAAACAALEPRPLFATRKPTKAVEYLQGVKLGPPERGSFVLAIQSPVPPGLHPTLPELEGHVEQPYERQVILTLHGAIVAARQAAEAALLADSLDPFAKAVDAGVSVNLCSALVKVHEAGGEGGIDLGFSWSRRRPAGPTLAPRLAIPAEAFQAIKEAVRTIAAYAPVREYELRGPVIKLERPHDGGPINRMTVFELADSGPRRVTVPLADADTSVVHRAFENELPVVCHGSLRREGRGYVLDGVRGVAVDEDVPI
jgi:hypothetical protein